MNQEISSNGVVWVVQDNGKFNLISAQKFGELKTLLPSRVQLQIDCGEAVDTIAKKLQGFNDNDSILALGDPAAIGIAFALAAAANGGVCHIIKYDRQTDAYYRVLVDMSHEFVCSSCAPYLNEEKII